MITEEYLDLKIQYLAEDIAELYNIDTQEVYNTLMYNIRYNIIGMLAINEKHLPKVNGEYLPLIETNKEN